MYANVNARARFWRRRSASLLIASCIALPSRQVAIAEAAPTCRSSDSTSAHLEAVLKRIVSSTDAASVSLRAALQLPQMSQSDVSLVTQSQTCGKAAVGLDGAQGSANPNRIMYVFKLGNTRYGVFEVVARTPAAGIDNTGDPIWYFTSKWAFLSSGMP